MKKGWLALVSIMTLLCVFSITSFASTNEELDTPYDIYSDPNVTIISEVRPEPLYIKYQFVDKSLIDKSLQNLILQKNNPIIPTMGQRYEDCDHSDNLQ